jgi:hypothetical protein
MPTPYVAPSLFSDHTRTFLAGFAGAVEVAGADVDGGACAELLLETGGLANLVTVRVGPADPDEQAANSTAMALSAASNAEVRFCVDVMAQDVVLTRPPVCQVPQLMFQSP